MFGCRLVLVNSLHACDILGALGLTGSVSIGGGGVGFLNAHLLLRAATGGDSGDDFFYCLRKLIHMRGGTDVHLCTGSVYDILCHRGGAVIVEEPDDEDEEDDFEPSKGGLLGFFKKKEVLEDEEEDEASEDYNSDEDDSYDEEDDEEEEEIASKPVRTWFKRVEPKVVEEDDEEDIDEDNDDGDLEILDLDLEDI